MHPPLQAVSSTLTISMLKVQKKANKSLSLLNQEIQDDAPPLLLALAHHPYLCDIPETVDLRVKGYKITFADNN
jgi:hypothetical protein